MKETPTQIIQADDLLESAAYKIIFNWSEKAFDDEEDCYYITAATLTAFFEIKWVEGGDFSIVMNGELIGNAEDMHDAQMFCVGALIRQSVMQIQFLAALGFTAGREFEKGRWDFETIRSFIKDQAFGIDALSEENIRKTIDDFSSKDYTEDTEDEEEERLINIGEVPRILH